MILDVPRFVAAERVYWEELDALLKLLEDEPERRMKLEEIERLYYLYERASSDLSRLDTFSVEPGVQALLESLVARAYSEIHETRAPIRARFKNVVFAFPRAFRRHARAFQLSVAITIIGTLFGGLAVLRDPASKSVVLPFPGLMISPSERVEQEEKAPVDRLQGVKA